jgi:hypothetical protein
VAALVCLTALAAGAWRSTPAANAGSHPPAAPVETVSRPVDDARPAAVRRWDAWDVGEARWFADLGSHFLRLDETGYYPALAYGGHHLYYARYTGAAWQIEIVDDAENVGAGASLALDSAGNPHVSYCDRTNNTLKYAYWTGMTWEIQWATRGEACGPTSLALDRADEPHISYAAGRTVQYVHWSGWRWDVQTVGAGARPELALDSADRPHIAYLGLPASSQLDPRANAIHHTWQDGAGWQDEVIVSYDHPRPCFQGCTYLTSLALALDRQDAPHVAYTYRSYGQIEGGASGLGYARRRAGAWVIEDGVNGAGAAVALAVDDAGYPHVTYTDASSAVRYRRWTGGMWEDQIIQPAATPGRLAIALSSQGVPHVAYENGEGRGGSDLRHAKLRDGVWIAEAVDRARDTGLNGSLALDSAGRPRLSYRDRDNALYYAVWTGGSWLVETVDGAPGPLLGQTSLALDGANRAHVAYAASDGKLKYARQAETGWQITTVPMQASRNGSPKCGAPPGCHSERVSPDTLVTVSFQRRIPGMERDSSLEAHCNALCIANPLRTCPFAALRAGSERSEGVTSRPIRLTLALDRAGDPAISYLGGDRVLRYARWDGVSWQTWDVEAFPQSRYTVSAVSLALDATAAPHIAYVVNGALRYARWDGRAWLIQEVEPNVGPGVSLALDRAGVPHVSYVAAAPSYALKYATRTAGGWQIQNVAPVPENAGACRKMSSCATSSDAAAARATFPALAFDAAGTPHVAYNSVRGGDGEAATQEIRHAQWTGDAWENETVTTFAAPALAYGQDPSPSLAIDPAGRPFIGYYDPVLHAARYAAGYQQTPATDCGPAPTPTPADPDPLPASGTVQRQIAYCVDDAYAVLGSTTSLYNGDVYVRMGGRPGALTPYVQYVAGLLFRDVRVPQGSQITSAQVRFNFWYQSGAPVRVAIAGQLNPQADDFRSANPWPHQRPRTVLRAAWTIIGTPNGPIESPDLAAVVEEVVGQGGWQAGNNLALLISPVLQGEYYLDWQAYDFSPANAAQLSISYEMPAAASTPTPTATAIQIARATTPSRSKWQLYLPLVLSR